jgi:L-amino acid N-acyltransferase YncA
MPLTAPLTIRPAALSDIPAITRIYAVAVEQGTASFELEPPDEAEMARRMQRLQEGGYPYIVAEREGAVAGYAYAGVYRPRPAYRWSVEDTVYIAPQHQRTGIGRELLHHLIQAAERGGFRQMIAVIGDSPNQAPSIGLHRQAGFRLVGILENVGFKHGRWLDSVLMQRSLGPGDAAQP